MNHLDKLFDFRMGPPWTSCTRAIYRTPFPDTEPNSIECWHNDFHGPVLDGDDLKALEWTTAEYSVLDDGRLDLIDCADAGRHVQITPLLFTGPDGAMRLGWPMAGYVDPNKGARWGRLGPAPSHEPPGPGTEAYWMRMEQDAVRRGDTTAVHEAHRKRWEILGKELDEIQRESTSSDDGGGPPVPSRVSVAFELPRPIADHPLGDFQPMSNGPSHISGTFVVHLSNEEIEEMIDDNVDQSPPFIEGGEIRVTRAIQAKDVIDAAAEKVSPRYADLVADTESATLRSDGGEGFLVEFTYDLDV